MVPRAVAELAQGMGRYPGCRFKVGAGGCFKAGAGDALVGAGGLTFCTGQLSTTLLLSPNLRRSRCR